MATCKECLHVDICNIKQRYNHPKYALQHIEKYCDHFKDSSRFVELPDYKYSAEERFRGAVQELIDIAKASETPSKVLQATSESLAYFACELSKLEELKQATKERENK